VALEIHSGASSYVVVPTNML